MYISQIYHNTRKIHSDDVRKDGLITKHMIIYDIVHMQGKCDQYLFF